MKRKRDVVETSTLPKETTAHKRWYDEWEEAESMRRMSYPINP